MAQLQLVCVFMFVYIIFCLLLVAREDYSRWLLRIRSCVISGQEMAYLYMCYSVLEVY